MRATTARLFRLFRGVSFAREGLGESPTRLNGTEKAPPAAPMTPAQRNAVGLLGLVL